MQRAVSLSANPAMTNKMRDIGRGLVVGTGAALVGGIGSAAQVTAIRGHLPS